MPVYQHSWSSEKQRKIVCGPPMGPESEKIALFRALGPIWGPFILQSIAAAWTQQSNTFTLVSPNRLEPWRPWYPHAFASHESHEHMS